MGTDRGLSLTDQQTRDFAQALARKRIRFAFPDDFTDLAGKLQNRIWEKHGKQSDEGKGLRALREIRVRAAPSWVDNHVDVMFWFIRNDDEPDFKGQRWGNLLERMAKTGATNRTIQLRGWCRDDARRSNSSRLRRERSARS